MLKRILFRMQAVSAALITSQVRNAMKENTLIPVLVQLKPADVQMMPDDGYEIVKEEELDSYANTVVSELKRHARSTNQDVRSLLDEWVSKGDIPSYRFFSISNTFAVEAPGNFIKILAQQSQVEEISSNNQVKLVNKLATNTEDTVNWIGDEKHWSLDYINATNLPDYIYEAAASLRFGNADTGVQFDHPALINSYMGKQKNGEITHNYTWWDASNGIYNSTEHICKPKSKIPCDDDGHGSHTLGTAVGGLNLGVSPTSKWMSCKNMYNDFGSPESYLGCLEFFLAPTDLDGKNPNVALRPHVINNSYACPPEEGCSETTFKYALKTLKAAGIFMSVAAGNEGEDGCSSITEPPAIDPNSFTVAATGYRSNKRASFSSLGPINHDTKKLIDISAPGENITSAFLNNTFASFGGTSMASPHVAGAVLLITAACPHLTRQVDRISNLLHLSAIPILPELKCGNDTATSVPNNEFGYGIINVGKAIQLCKVAPFLNP